MPPDLTRYAHFLDDFDMSEREKSELMHTLWQVMESFVERAFAGERRVSGKGLKQIVDSAGRAAHVESISKPNIEPLRMSFAWAVRRDGSRRGSP